MYYRDLSEKEGVGGRINLNGGGIDKDQVPVPAYMLGIFCFVKRQNRGREES